MRGLPILNPRLAVEATGIREFGDHVIFVMISPWFMNLVVLPGTEEWNGSDQGECCEFEFPGELLEFSVCHDADFGTFLSTVLFRTMSDFPDQDMARDVAMEVVRELFATQSATTDNVGSNDRKTISRRSLLTGLGTN